MKFRKKIYIRWSKIARSELVALPSSSFRRGFVHASHPFPTHTLALCSHTFRRTTAAMASEAAVSRQDMRLLQAALVHVYAKYANFTYSQ